MFQLIASIDSVNLVYNRKHHVWQNLRLFPNSPLDEIAISKDQDKCDAMEMIGILVFMTPAKIEYRQICLN